MRVPEPRPGMNLCEVQALRQPTPSRDWGERCSGGSAGQHFMGAAAIDTDIATSSEVTQTLCEKDQPLGGELQAGQELLVEGPQAEAPPGGLANQAEGLDFEIIR